MSRQCDICGRKPVSSIKRSHSMIATKRKQKINLQIKNIQGKRVKICTRCLRTMTKKEQI